MKKRFILIVFLAAALTYCQSAQALLYLPDSDYGTTYGWQGSETYTENGYEVYVEFNVYDTETFNDEFTWTAGEGLYNEEDYQYIYAYQLFIGDGKDILSFGLIDLLGDPVDPSLMDYTTGQDDEHGGVAPSPPVSTVQGVWQFEAGTLIEVEGEKRSWFLIFRTDHAPVVGYFELTSPQFPVVPEPATVALLGIGIVVLLRRRKSAR